MSESSEDEHDNTATQVRQAAGLMREPSYRYRYIRKNIFLGKEGIKEKKTDSVKRLRWDEGVQARRAARRHLASLPNTREVVRGGK